MPAQRRWSLIPRTTASCALFVVAGIVLVAYDILQMADAGEVAVLPTIALVLGLAVLVVGVVGLVAPRLRGR